jgi:hypothetical protein
MKKIEAHEALIWWEMAKNKAREAQTAWAIVDQSAVSHFESTERMFTKAEEAEDKGDQAFARSFTTQKTWKQLLMENICWIILIFGIIVLIWAQQEGYIS